MCCGGLCSGRRVRARRVGAAFVERGFWVHVRRAGHDGPPYEPPAIGQKTNRLLGAHVTATAILTGRIGSTRAVLGHPPRERDKARRSLVSMGDGMICAGARENREEAKGRNRDTRSSPRSYSCSVVRAPSSGGARWLRLSSRSGSRQTWGHITGFRSFMAGMVQVGVPSRRSRDEEPSRNSTGEPLTRPVVTC